MTLRYSPKTHATQTERAAIQQMLAQGATQARNRPDTKRYTVLDGNGHGEYKIAVDTFAKWWIGEDAKWRRNIVEVKVQKSTEPQLKLFS